MEAPANSRRSAVYSTKGMVSSTQPLANSGGIKILEKGGNCVDACIAISACLCILEPASTGIGGDCFALFYRNKNKKVYGLNGTGRSASALNINWIKQNYPDHILPNMRLKDDSIFKVQVPGAIAGWWDAYENWGSGNVSFAELLQPAIDLAENGYVISQISDMLWKLGTEKLLRENKMNKDLELFLPNDNFTAPNRGQFLINKDVAKTLRKVAVEGKDGFYKGEVAMSIVKEMRKRGSPITLEDLSNHTSTFVDPISYTFLDHKLWEIPPNGSGIIALMTLGLINSLNERDVIDLKKITHNSSEYLHLIIECLKISFRDSEEYVNDYEFFKDKHQIDQKENISKVLGPEYLQERSKCFDRSKSIINEELVVPNPIFKSDTVYFTATDNEGNACSFINSLYEGFGSGIIVPDRGFILHNRGGNFSLNPGSRNCLEGGKRSYHTIIPGMITKASILNHCKDELYASYGVMGGYNQPQAHVQVYLNLLLFGMDPQEALDAPRISLFAHPDMKNTDKGMGSDGPMSRHATCVGVEPGVSQEVVEELRKLGHDVKLVEGNGRKLFGRGQIIRKESSEDASYLVYSGGSDPRGDGASVPLL